MRSELRTAVNVQLYDALIDEIAGAVAVPPYVAVVRGLPLASPSRLLLGLSTGLGELVFPDRGQDTCAVDIIRPRTDFETPQWGVNNESLHTDSTTWRQPNRYTCLFTVLADSGGGITRLLDIDTVEQALGDSPLLEFLRSRSVPFRLDEPSGGLRWRPIIRHGTIQWARFAIGRDKFGSECPLEAGVHQALEQFHRFLADCDSDYRVGLEPGDLLVVDNTRSLHCRTRVGDPHGSERLLLRTRIGSA